MASRSAGGTSPREAPSLTGSAASRSPRPSAGEGAALYSSVEFARALAALQRGSPLLKWSKRAQAPRARLFTLRVPVDAEPAAVAALAWPRGAGAMLPAWAAGALPARGAPHVLRLADVSAVHAIADAALPALLPGAPEPHFALSLSYAVRRGSSPGPPRAKSLLLLWPESAPEGGGKARFDLEARCLLYGVHAGCMGLDAGAGFDAGFARYLLRAPLAAAAALISEKLGATRLVSRIDAAWFGAPASRAAAAGEDDDAEDAAPQQQTAEPATDAVVASRGRVRLMVDGIEVALAPCIELDALLRALPAGGRPRGLGASVGAAPATGDVRPSREAVAAFRELTRLQNLATRRLSAAEAAAPSSARISASAAASPDGGPSDVKAGIEANSPYIAAVRRDVEVHGDAIPALAARAREARAEAGSLAPVRACLASLEQTLCRLTDERAVLKHFDWPEAKVDAMREAVALQDECAALRAALEQWRAASAGGHQAGRGPGVAPPPAGASLSAVHQAATRALEKVQPRVEALVRDQDALRARFANHGVAFDIGAELQRVRHAAVAVARRLLAAAEPAASPPEPPGRSAAARRGAEAESSQDAALRLAFRVHQFAGGFDAETEALWLALAARLQALVRRRAEAAPEDAAAA